MALATRCPQCQAMFRVVADQLKLRGGLVRCGSCRHVFDAIGSLAYVDEARLPGAPAPTPAHPTSAVPAAVATPAPKAAALTPPAASARPPWRDAEASMIGVPTLLLADLPSQCEVPAVDAAPVTQDRVAQTAIPNKSLGGAAAPPPSELVAGQQAEAGTPERADPDAGKYAAPLVDRPADAGEAEAAPTFLRRAPRRRGLSVAYATGSSLLAFAALLQLTVLFRAELAVAAPALRPALVELCKPLHCAVGWPRRAELLAVVGTELQAVPGTEILELTAVVRSRATHTLALPAIEVTLTDTQNRALARRVFAPADYLASDGEPLSRIDAGLAAGADYTVRLSFEARGLSATGFVVYPFYL
jgi:predicted Zn finger-like uncharacterized protein